MATAIYDACEAEFTALVSQMQNLLDAHTNGDGDDLLLQMANVISQMELEVL